MESSIGAGWAFSVGRGLTLALRVQKLDGYACWALAAAMKHQPSFAAEIGHLTHFLPDGRAVVTWPNGANGPGKVIFSPETFFGFGRAAWVVERVKKCSPPQVEIAEALAMLKELSPDCRAPATQGVERC